MSSLIQSEPKVEGKRGQEDVSGSLIGLDENEIKRPKPSSHGDEESLFSLAMRRQRDFKDLPEDPDKESLFSLAMRRQRDFKDLPEDPDKESLLSLIMRRQRYYKDLPEEPDRTLVSIMWRNANLKKDLLTKDADVCRCGHPPGHAHAPDHLLPRDPRVECIPGILVPRFLWHFLDEMIAKSDDRTLVASGLSHEINDDTCFLELFKPFGEVISANLAVLDPEHNCGGLFGFVTFLTKKAAKRAIRTLNGGSDHIRHVIWAKQINMPPMDPRYLSIPGIFVPPVLWPFVEEMTAKSDDKTVLASNLTLEIDEDTRLLELFKPYGEVIRANLAPIDPEHNRGALFGFVTFVTKEGAEQAIRTLNGSGPHGWDKRILKVNWAKHST